MALRKIAPALLDRCSSRNLEAGSSSPASPQPSLGRNHSVLDYEVAWPHENLDPDTFGLAICSLIRDSHLIAMRKGSLLNRTTRMLTTLLLLFMCLGIQIYLLVKVKQFVTAKAVHDIRQVYDNFEHVMYHGHTWEHAKYPPERRGIGGPGGPYFDPLAFESLSEDEKSDVCCIPFSQPLFFSTVILIWSITCLFDMRTCWNLFDSLIVNTQRCDSMSQAFETPDNDHSDVVVIAQLTRFAKTYIFVLVILPRFLIASVLLWLGCRWLLATNDFADLILNGLALELILKLKDVLYLALVPRRSKVDLERTAILPANLREPESAVAFAHTVVWALCAVLWVMLYLGSPYMHGLQRVLVDYQWDVHDVCSGWIRERYLV